MTTVQTANTKMEKIATASLGLQLISLIAMAINALNLNRQQILSWTNNVAKLRKWVQLLTENVEPLPAKKASQHCILTDTGFDKPGSSMNEEQILAASEWILVAESDPTPAKLTKAVLTRYFTPGLYSELTKLRKHFNNIQNSVYRCDITGVPSWKIQFFREIFDFYGQDTTLADLFVFRDVVWTFEEVISLLARTIHDHDDDPLGLQFLKGSCVFPIYLSSPFDDNVSCTKEVEKNIVWLELYGLSEKKHLGKQQWRLRILESLEGMLKSHMYAGNCPIGPRQTSIIFFRGDPRKTDEN